MKRALVGLAVLVALAAAAGVAAFAWLVSTEAGLRWAVAEAEALSAGRLSISEPRGTLAEQMSFGRIAYADAGVEVIAEQVSGAVSLMPMLRGRLGIEPLRIEALRLSVQHRNTGGEAAPAPLPLSVRLAGVSVSRIEVHAGADRYVLEDFRLAHAALGPRAVAARGEASWPDARLPATVRFTLDGTLDEFTLALEGKSDAHPVTAKLQARVANGGAAGTIALENAQPGPLDAGRVPVVSARARFSSPDFARARLEELRVTLAGGGTLTGQGEVSADGARARVEVSGLDLKAAYSTLHRTALAGALELEVTLEAQSVRGRLAQDGMSVRADVTRRGDTISIEALRAEARGGTLTGDGTIGLGETLRAKARLELARLDPSAFGDYPRGSISGRFDLDGRADGAPTLDARWRIEQSRLDGRALASTGRARFSRARIADARIEASYGPARASVHGAFGRAGDRLAWTFALDELRAEGRLEGTLQAHELRVSAQASPADVQAHLRGGLEGSTWQGEIRSLRNEGEYPLRLLAPAPLSVSPERAALGRFEAALDAGRILVREAHWHPSELRTSGEFSALPARWLALAAGLGERLRATMLVDGSWSIARAGHLEGTLRLTRRSGDLTLLLDGEPVPLELDAATLEARAQASGLALELTAASRYGKLALSGTIGNAPGGLPGPGSPLDLNARLDAAALAVLAQPIVTEARIDGRLWAELRIAGTLGEPRVAGTLRGEALSLAMPPYGVYLRNGLLVAELAGDRLRVTEFSVRGAGGEFTAQSELPLGLEGGATQIEWSARSLGLLERPDLRLVVSGAGRAGFDGKRVSLSGRVRADRGHLVIDRQRLPRPGEDVAIAGAPSRAANGRPPLPVDLDVTLELGSDLRLEAEGFDGRLTGEVRFTTVKDGELRAHGQVRSVNATLFAFQQRLVVDPGQLSFDGPLDNPALNVTAWRRNQAVEVGVQVSGTVQVPRVALVSIPPVPQADRLSWLVLGRPPGEATKADVALLQTAAGALLARGQEAPLGRRVAGAFGLDEVTLRGVGEAEGSVVAVGKRLSDRLYVSYEQGMGEVATNLVKLDYALGKRWSLRAETGTTSGAGLFYRFAWD